jgi:hypothetical protein
MRKIKTASSLRDSGGRGFASPATGTIGKANFMPLASRAVMALVNPRLTPNLYASQIEPGDSQLIKPGETDIPA